MDVDFRNGDSKTNFQVLQDARWNIFILSEDAVKDGTMSAQFQAALEYSISDNEVQVYCYFIFTRFTKIIRDFLTGPSLLVSPKKERPQCQTCISAEILLKR